MTKQEEKKCSKCGTVSGVNDWLGLCYPCAMETIREYDAKPTHVPRLVLHPDVLQSLKEHLNL